MKYALLILWHKDTVQLERLLSYFDDDFDCYVHIDRKSVMSQYEMDTLSNLKPRVCFYRKFNIRWGGISIVKAELFLLEKIVKSGIDYGYIHFLSGQDYPIKKLNQIKNYFKEHSGWEFIEYMTLPSKKKKKGTYRRFRYFLPYDFVDCQNPKGQRIISRLVKWQEMLGIKRHIPDQYDRLFGGSNWMSITNKCAKYIINYNKKQKLFYNRLKYTFAPDEVYFHTIIMNSSFCKTSEK